MTTKPKLKIALWTIGGLLVILLLVLALAFFWIYKTLKSPEAMKKHIPQIQNLLQEHANIKTQFETISLDIHSYLNLENIIIEWHEGNTRFHASVKKFRLSYDLSQIWEKIILAEYLIIEDFHGVLHMDKLNKKKETEAKKQESTDWQKIHDILIQPGIQIYVKSVLVKNGRFDVIIKDPKMTLNTSIYPINITGNGQLAPEDSQTNLHIAIASDKSQPLHLLQNPNKDEKTEVALKEFNLTFQLKLAAKTRNQKSIVSIKPQIEASFQGLEVTQKKHKQNLTLTWPQGKFRNQWTVKTLEESQLQQNSLGNFLPIQATIDTEFQSSQVDLFMKDQQKSRNLKLTPKLAANVKATIFHNQKPWQSLQATYAIQASGSNFDFSNNQGTYNASFSAKNLSFTSEIEQPGKGLSSVNRLAALDANINKIKPIKNITMDLDINSDADWKNSSFRLVKTIDSEKFLTWNASIVNADKTLNLSQTLNIHMDENLSRLSKDLHIIERIGSTDLKIEGQHSLQHQADSIFAADLSKITSFPSLSKLTFTLNQIKKPSREELFTYKSPITLNLDTKMNDEKIDNQLQLSIKNLQAHPLKQAINIEAQGRQRFPLNLSESDISHTVYVNQEPTIEFNLTHRDLPKLGRFKLKLLANINQTMAPLLQQLKTITSLGSLNIEQDITFDITHPFSSLKKLSIDDTSSFAGKMVGNTKVTQTKSAQIQKKGAINFSEPISMETTGEFRQTKASLEHNIKIPEAVLIQIGKIAKTNITLTAESAEKKNSKHLADILADLDIDLDVHGGQIILYKSPGKNKNSMGKFSLTMQTNLRDGSVLSMEKLAANIGNPLLNLLANARIELQKRDVQSEGRLQVFLPTRIPGHIDISAAGNVLIPWTVFVENGERLDVNSPVQFNNVEFSDGTFSIKGLQGKLGFQESIAVKDEKFFQFTHLIENNPFNRVDYSAVSPFLKKTRQLKIDTIKYKDWKVGPLTANAHIEQNYLSFPSFSLSLFSGDLSGQFFLDTYPKALKFGLLARFTNINPSKIITNDKGLLKEQSKKVISGSVNLVFDLRKRLTSGKVNITEIGSEQLLHLIDIFDPEYEDPDLNTLRNLLGLGYPERLSLEMKHGFLDIDIDVNVAGVSKNQSIFGVPLTAIIESHAGEAITELLQKYEKIYPLSE